MLVGFDPNNCLNCLTEIKNSYFELYDALNNQMQNLFFLKISDKWACKQAIEFFQDSKEIIEQLINEYVNSTYDKIINFINITSINMSQSAKINFTGISFQSNLANIKADYAKENIGNIRGINLMSVREITKNSLQTISETSTKSIIKAENAIISFTGLYGEFERNKDMFYKLLTSLSNKINDMFRKIMELINKYIKSTVGEFGYNNFL